MSTSPTIRPTRRSFSTRLSRAAPWTLSMRSPRSGALARWRTEILAHHTTGASNKPTEGLNLLIKKVKRAGHGFRSFANYRLRILLHAESMARAAPPRAAHPKPLATLKSERLYPREPARRP